MSEQQTEVGIVFPCDFSVKVMGIASDDFDAIVVGIIRPFVTDIKEGAVTVKHSSTSKFTSVTVDFHIESKQKLDALYQALMEHEQVKYIL